MLENYELIKKYFPESIKEVDGSKETVDMESLIFSLANEVADLRDRNDEKDFQISSIFNKIDQLN